MRNPMRGDPMTILCAAMYGYRVAIRWRPDARDPAARAVRCAVVGARRSEWFDPVTFQCAATACNETSRASREVGGAAPTPLQADAYRGAIGVAVRCAAIDAWRAARCRRRSAASHKAAEASREAEGDQLPPPWPCRLTVSLSLPCILPMSAHEQNQPVAHATSVAGGQNAGVLPGGSFLHLR